MTFGAIPRRGPCLFPSPVYGLHSPVVVEDALAQAKGLRRDLQKLVVGEELQALLQAHLPGGDEAQRLVGPGGAGVG